MGSTAKCHATTWLVSPLTCPPERERFAGHFHIGGRASEIVPAIVFSKCLHSCMHLHMHADSYDRTLMPIRNRFGQSGFVCRKASLAVPFKVNASMPVP